VASFTLLIAGDLTRELQGVERPGSWYQGYCPGTGRWRSEAACSRRGRSDERGTSPANADTEATSDSRSPYVSAPPRVKEGEECRRKEQERQEQQNGPTMW